MTGDGSDTTLALGTTPDSENQTFVTIDGVVQHKDTYSISGSTLTFSTAPPTGAKVECITFTNVASTTFEDADGDTKIQVEESTDEDKIRFDTGGTERMVIDSTGVGIGTTPSAVGNYKVLQVRGDSTSNGGLIRLETSDGTSGVARLFAGSTSTVLESNSNTNLVFQTNATERMRISSGGNVGIGTTSPAVLNHISAGYSAPTNGIDSNIFSLISNSASTGSYAGLGLLAGTAAASFIHFGDTDDMNVGTLDYFHSDNSMRFSTNGSERMRIASGGALMIGTTSDVGTSGARIEMINVSDGGRLINTKDIGNGSCNAITFNNSNGQVGRITTSGSSTSYVTSSDYRMKENLVYDWEALPKIKDLKPVQFNFITNPDELTEGFLAHEAQSVVPYGVVGEKDGEEMQGIDQSKLVPLLTKAIQEQQELIKDLKSRIEVLETPEAE